MAVRGGLASRARMAMRCRWPCAPTRLPCGTLA
uniref:Uncharacterized protein n=1 Tax=Arundo donax TaxID=35708 RepID=A0A0A8YDA7_ARUDO